MLAMKKLTAAAAALAVMGTLAASTTGTAAASSSKVTLNVLMPVSPDTTALEAAFPGFEKATGIKVNLTTVPQDQLASRVQTQVITGAGTYDVAGFQYELMPGYAKGLLSLNKYFTAADKKDITPTGLQAGSVNGTIYGQLYVSTMQVLLYRKDLLARDHLTVPTTWSAYLADAKKLTTSNPKLWGTIVEAEDNEEPVGMFLDYLYQAGGDVLGRGNKVTIDDAAAQKALQFEVNLVSKYKVAPPGAADYSTLDIANLYQDGQVALAPDWAYQYALSTAKTSKYKNDTGVAPLPCDVKCGVSLGGWVLSAFKATKQPAAAAKFIQYMTSAKTQLMMALTDGSQPTRYSVINNSRVKSNPVFKVMSQELKYAVSRTKYPNYPQIEDALATAMSAAVSGQQSVKSALTTAAQTIQQSVPSS